MGVHISQLPQHVKDRLGLKDPQHKQFWAVIGSKEPIYFRSSWEYYYAIFLEKLRQERKIIDWRHEPKCFWFEGIKRGVRSYLPDFCVLHLNNTEEWAEVKGYYDSKSQTKTLNGLQDQTSKPSGESMDGLHPQRRCCHHRLRSFKNL